MWGLTPRLLASETRAVYSMSAGELATAFKTASAAGMSSSPKMWDALMFRASVIGKQFSCGQVAQILAAFIEFPKYTSNLFLEHLTRTRLEISPLSPASIMDVTMIMHAVNVLHVFDLDERKIFWHNCVSPYIMERIKPTIRFDDLSKIAVLACKYGDQQVKSKCVEILLNMKSFPKDPKRISQLLDAFVPFSLDQPMPNEDEIEPFYDVRAVSTSSWDSVNFLFLTKLMDQAIALSPRFNTRDLISFGRAVGRIPSETLSAKLGHSNRLPLQNLVSRCATRELLRFKPSELVQVLKIYREMGIGDRSKIIAEIQYRLRQLRPGMCVQILDEMTEDEKKENSKSPGLVEDIFARLTKYDANSTLTPGEILSLAGVAVRHTSPTSMLVVKNLLPNLKRKNLDIVRFIQTFSELTLSDPVTFAKIFRFNRAAVIEAMSAETAGNILLCLVKLEIFDLELWEYAKQLMGVPDETFMEAYNLETLRNGREWPKEMNLFVGTYDESKTSSSLVQMWNDVPPGSISVD